MIFRSKKKVLDNNQFYQPIMLNLYPTKEQEYYLNRAVELCRFIYNWTIDFNEAYYKKNGKQISELEIKHELSVLRNKTPWLQEVPLTTLRNAMFDALVAYKNWFNKKLKNKKPKYKSKKKSKKSFSPRPDRSYIKNNTIKIEGVPGKISIKWNSGFSGTQKERKELDYSNMRSSIDPLGKWKISFTILTTKVVSTNYDNLYETYTPKYNRAIGIDLNKKNLIVTSYMDGEIYKLPDTVEKYIEKYEKIHNNVYKDIRLIKKHHPEIINWDNKDFSDYKSNNAKKRQIKCNKAKRKVKNIINTYTHTISKKIITRYPKAIVMEDLPIREMYTRHNTAKGVSYIPFYNIRKIFENKCNKYNIPFILARKDYPSTQRCSCCGSLKKMDGKHTYICPVCGNKMDRDINAAFNLEQLAYKDCIDPFIWMSV